MTSVDSLNLYHFHVCCFNLLAYAKCQRVPYYYYHFHYNIIRLFNIFNFGVYYYFFLLHLNKSQREDKYVCLCVICFKRELKTLKNRLKALKVIISIALWKKMVCNLSLVF